MSADHPQKIGKYEIQGVLGRGGMGVVYKAFDPAIHRQVAIKTIIKSAMDPSELQYAIARFRHEAQAVGRLTHPRIAAIYDYGEDMDLAYIVMELVNGRSLMITCRTRRSSIWQKSARSSVSCSTALVMPTPKASCTATSNRRTS